jgi:hypothetical protein
MQFLNPIKNAQAVALKTARYARSNASKADFYKSTPTSRLFSDSYSVYVKYFITSFLLKIIPLFPKGGKTPDNLRKLLTVFPSLGERGLMFPSFGGVRGGMDRELTQEILFQKIFSFCILCDWDCLAVARRRAVFFPNVNIKSSRQ